MRQLVVLTIAAVGLLALAVHGRRKAVTVKHPRTTLAAHQQAAELARAAFESVVHQSPTLNELRILLAVALHETTFGAGWKGAGEGSNNEGAIQATASWTGDTFGATDTHPTETGGSISYSQAFRKYATALEGWQDLVRVLYVQMSAVRRAAATGDPREVARAMRTAKYYQGHGATEAERIAGYEQALVNALWEIDHYETALVALAKP
jgi:hypothetical protein